MNKFALVALAAASFSSAAFAESDAYQSWRVTGDIPTQWCSPGIYNGQQCTSDIPIGYQCRLGNQMWRCDWYSGANRVHYIGDIPYRYCDNNVYEGAYCQYNGDRCIYGNLVMVCRR